MKTPSSDWGGTSGIYELLSDSKGALCGQQENLGVGPAVLGDSKRLRDAQKYGRGI